MCIEFEISRDFTLQALSTCRQGELQIVAQIEGAKPTAFSRAIGGKIWPTFEVKIWRNGSYVFTPGSLWLTSDSKSLSGPLGIVCAVLSIVV